MSAITTVVILAALGEDLAITSLNKYLNTTGRDLILFQDLGGDDDLLLVAGDKNADATILCGGFKTAHFELADFIAAVRSAPWEHIEQVQFFLKEPSMSRFVPIPIRNGVPSIGGAGVYEMFP